MLPGQGISALSDVAARDLGRMFGLATVVVVVSDVPNTIPTAFTAARVVLALLLLSTLVLPPRTAISLFLLLTLAGRDIEGVRGVGDTYASASVWQMSIGPVKPSWIIFTVMLALAFRFSVHKQIAVVTTPVIRAAMIWLATVPVVTGFVYGGFFTDNSFTEVLVDIKFGAVLILSLILFLSVLKRLPGALDLLLTALVAGLLARHLADLLYAANNYGPELAPDVGRASVDSAKGGVVLLAYIGIVFVTHYRRLVAGTVVATLSISLLAIYGTRMLWVTFFAGLALLILHMRGSNLLRSTFFTVAAIGGAVWAISFIAPDTTQVLRARAITVTEGRALSDFTVGADYNALSRIDPVRYGEIVNILDSAHERMSYLWGTGYGGFYHDDVVTFPRTMTSSFPDYSLESGIFYSAHDFVPEMFLKHGIVGLLIISALWIGPAAGLSRIVRRNGRRRPQHGSLRFSIIMAILPFMVTGLLQLYWSGKGLLVNGVIIAVALSYQNRVGPGIHPRNSALAGTSRTSRGG